MRLFALSALFVLMYQRVKLDTQKQKNKRQNLNSEIVSLKCYDLVQKIIPKAPAPNVL